MIWIFPMAGYGTRTKKYGEFKPLIEVCKGYSILKICLSGIKEMIKSDDEMIFITTTDQDKDHSVEQNIKKLLVDLDLKIEFKVVLLKETPKGQALTIKKAIKKINYNQTSKPCLVINPDQLIFFDLDSIDKSKCSVGIYFNTKSSSCFYNLGIYDDRVKEIKEKIKISHYASSGVFYFNSIKNLYNCIKWAENNNKFFNGELFLGPCMQYFNDLLYFQTIVKFDLGNEYSIELFKKFTKHLTDGEK
tara:strand:- start:84 stop:824 length:741 start_codon:yes stop_codon:yes gene_type:complete